MKKVELNNILDLMDEIKKLDALLLLHSSMGQDDFMISQYQSKKVKLMAELIDALASPKIQSEQSFSLIQKILGKFYPQINDRDLEDESFKEIVASI
ncbi:hypothetical protein [Sphingobacterium faecium]|uniref:hypothetical protein n=1 Tax=Sphingobacterium faecium TaxID=34087 RepID=UPI00320B8D03